MAKWSNMLLLDEKTIKLKVFLCRRPLSRARHHHVLADLEEAQVSCQKTNFISVVSSWLSTCREKDKRRRELETISSSECSQLATRIEASIELAHVASIADKCGN